VDAVRAKSRARHHQAPSSSSRITAYHHYAWSESYR